MSKLPNKPRASNVARGMILARTGIGKFFKDRRSKRSQDKKNSWQKDWQGS